MSIRDMPGSTPGSRVCASSTPVIKSITRNEEGNKRATVEYTDTTDNRTHVVTVPPSSLRGGEAAFKIGDKVRLKSTQGGVYAPQGSVGTLLGGRGNNHTVAFVIDHDEVLITLTHDHIPGELLEFEEEAKSESSSEGDESSQDSGDDVSDESESSECEEGVLWKLRSGVSPSVLEEAMQMLSLDELEEVAGKMESGVEYDEVGALVKLLD